jgi:hypothetical protein
MLVALSISLVSATVLNAQMTPQPDRQKMFTQLTEAIATSPDAIAIMGTPAPRPTAQANASRLTTI